MKQLKSGIYAIINIVDDKVYVGKSINIEKRWRSHKQSFLNDSKDANRHLKNAVNKYGIANFKLEILEEISINQNDGYFNDREIFWMDYLNSCNRQNGYNLRRDSSTRMFVSDETRILQSEMRKGENNSNYGNIWSDEMKEKMSNIKKLQYSSGEQSINWDAIEKGHRNKAILWKENPQLKLKMAKRVSESKSLYNILKIDMNNFNCIEIFDTFMKLKEKYPNVGKTVVFSACNGCKKSYKGFYWRYQDKKTLEIIEPKGKYGVNIQVKNLPTQK